jgi:hypothetical protein
VKNEYLKPKTIEIACEDPMMLVLSAPGLEDTESSEEIPGEEIEADAPIIRRGVWGDLWAEPIDPEAI